MNLSLPRWLDRLLFVRPLLTRDAEGRYVSPAGRAYRVVVAPQPGAEDLILVTLLGAPCVPNTFLNHLEVRVPARASAVDDAIRELLARADDAEARYTAVRSRYEWEAVTVKPPVDEGLPEPPEGLIEALRSGSVLPPEALEDTES